MSPVTVRPYEEADAEGFFRVRSLTYNNGDPVPQEKRVFKNLMGFVGEQDGQIKGIFVILPLTCTRGEALLQAGGVAAVAVLPHERKSGVGKAMMEWWVREARSRGIHMSSLYGFSERYYRQFGYEVCGKRIKITCPSDKLPRLEHNLPLRVLGPDDWEQLDACQQAFAHARSGLSVRNEKLWHRVLAENRRLTVYVAGEPVQAYAVVSHKVDFWSTDHISDTGWSSPEGYAGLMDILRGLAVNKTGLSWHEPSDSPFLASYLDTKVETVIERPIMYRVNDVPGALRALTPEQFGQFSVRVQDELVPENVGPWRVELIDGKVSVQKSDNADIEIDVRHFAQSFLGDPSFADLLRNGFVKVNNPQAIGPASRLFSPMPVYCPEFF
ncbi:MAG TPA: GNAT family N-acetyltransferase [Fimbriimonas sp.]|nr:GNAT family N-acetyltransferase [Fimbriimonas sp.]